MAAEITQRRMAWLDQVLPGMPGYRALGPRGVYELLFFSHMGLERDELPVVAESADEIVWLSRNRCTLLEACLALGLDTRQVCRPVNEQATQAFVSRIDPQLRFHRSYEEIRPHAAHCREWIVRVDFERSMRLAIAQARLAAAEGRRGRGAVVQLEGRTIGVGHDTAWPACDPGQHAEAIAMRQALAARGEAGLCGAILFVTTEPCPACMSLAARARVTTVVYGAAREAAGPGVQGGAGEVAGLSTWAPEVIGHVLHEACGALCWGS